MKSYKFLWQPEKTTVKLPENFALQFGDTKAVEIPLIFVDENKNKGSVIYNGEKNSILLKSLIWWINNFDPQVGEEIELKGKDKATYEISIPAGGPPKTKDGLYLGKRKDEFNQYVSERRFILPVEDLVTHIFICGATGSGKTVFGKAVIEEAAKRGIPSLVVDLKGDLSSLGLLFPKTNYQNLLPWVSAPPERKRQKCREEVRNFNENLKEFGFSKDDLKEYASKVSIAVFSPKVGKGIRLAIASPLAAPKDIQHLLNTNKNEVLEMIGSFTQTFTKNLFAERKIKRLDKFKTFLQETVQYCWENGINLEGKRGLERLLGLIKESPVKKIGGMPLNEFISEKMRNELATRIAMCLSGVEQLWFEGVPLDINTLLKRPRSEKGRTPVSIINVAELSFDDQMHVISHLTYSLYNWARPKGDAGGQPRIIFSLDEIGGGGGKQAFYPSFPYDPPSKPAINILLRKGRTFGISCVFASQNPGDIDYKGLSNCGTWAVSRLQTDRDRKKIQQGISTAEVYIENVSRKLANLTFGDFLVKTKDGRVNFIKERWLASYHKTLSDKELKKINKKAVVKYFDKFVTR